MLLKDDLEGFLEGPFEVLWAVFSGDELPRGANYWESGFADATQLGHKRSLYGE